MRLSEFIASDMERILVEWEAFARTRLPAAQDMSPEALRNGAQALLLELAGDITTHQSGESQAGKSRGQRPENAPQMTDEARQHAHARLTDGFSLEQMVSEYRALRASVVRLWTEQLHTVDRDTLGELIRFDEALDQALTESIAWYSQQLERSRDLLLGALGHDLRNPLGAIRNSACLLLRNEELGGKEIDAATRILRSGTRMRHMVDDLLDFTRTRLGRGLPITLGAADLGEVCHQVVEELEAFHPERTLRLDCSSELAGRWDAPRLGQLVSNLVANAIQHGDPDTPVTVTALHEAHEVILHVHNAGSPIPRDAQAALFEPPTRAAAQEAEQHEGSSGLGLGLYIAHQIALAHGGSIEVASSEAHGTRFTVRLPRQAQADRRRTAGIIG